MTSNVERIEKMKKVLFSFVVSFLFLSSCSGVDPVSWNAEVVGVYDKMLEDIEDFQDLISLETIGDTAVNRRIANKGNVVIIDLNKSIKYISEGNVPSGADRYQTAAVEMLEAAREQINVGLRFTQLSESTTEFVIEEYASKYDLASIDTAKKVDFFIDVQSQFAAVETVKMK